MSDVFKLACWVRGSPVHASFIITISSTETVDALKVAIKESQGLTVPAPDLRLFNLRDSESALHKEDLANLILSVHGVFLDDATHALSRVFPAPPHQGHLHIVVDTPSPRIFYWFRGANISQENFLEVQSGEKISTFKSKITERHVELSGTFGYHLNPYRVFKDKIGECLYYPDKGKLLGGKERVYDCFVDIPVLQSYCVIILISNDKSIPEPFCETIAGEDLIEEEDPIKVARKEFLKTRPPIPPSDTFDPLSFFEMQRNPKTRIPCGRPRYPEGLIPATLLHPVFCQFLEDCETHSVTAEDNMFVYELANVLTEMYSDERSRANQVRGLLTHYGIELRLTTEAKTDHYLMHGDLSVGKHCYMIAEFQSEAEASVPEPYIQAALRYLEGTRTQAIENTGSPLPCLLLIFYESFVVFAAAAWNTNLMVEPLSTPITFYYPSYNPHLQVAAARHMAAFRKAVQSLEQYYKSLPADGLSNEMSLPMMFPYPTSFTSLADNSKKTFRYRERVKDDHDRQLVFFGTQAEDSGAEIPICIKFVQRYSPEAHMHCARSGLAPTLRGFESTMGGWYMVVMDELIGYKLLADLSNFLPKPVFEAIRMELDQLHSDGLVHGDIRDVNIMVKEMDDGETFQPMVIDFDWAGELNVIRYPPFVNRNDLARPEEARDGRLILAEHDDLMLEDIVKRYSEWDK